MRHEAVPGGRVQDFRIGKVIDTWAPFTKRQDRKKQVWAEYNYLTFKHI